MGFDFGTVAMPYGDAWRTSRRLMHTHLNQGAASKYQPTQVTFARKLARDILRAKQDIGVVSQVVHANFGRMMVTLMYGIHNEDAVSKQLSLAEKAMEAFSVGFTPGNFLVDVLPLCKGTCFFCFCQLTITNHSEVCSSVVSWSWVQVVRTRDTGQPPPLA
jgi:hypothetical protein